MQHEFESIEGIYECPASHRLARTSPRHKVPCRPSGASI
jgi:hypothetical protein